jgi:hypothetical protein
MNFDLNCNALSKLRPRWAKENHRGKKKKKKQDTIGAGKLVRSATHDELESKSLGIDDQRNAT